MSDENELRKALSRLANASHYLISNYLEDERTDQNLCHDKDHWAAINLVYDCTSVAMDVLKRSKVVEHNPPGDALMGNESGPNYD